METKSLNVDNFCCESVWLYPNGGTSESPKEIEANKRYVLDNPFPGHKVKCYAEILLNGEWSVSGWLDIYNGLRASSGVSVVQLSTSDKIVIQTATDSLVEQSSYMGNGFGISQPPAQVKKLSCRLYVEKGGRLPQAGSAN